jgi:hypothetical protein
VGQPRVAEPSAASAPPRDQSEVSRQLRLPDGRVLGLPREGETLSLGRDAANAVVVSDPDVSRNHAALRRENGVLWLRDTSTNGTMLNGARVEKSVWVKVPDDATIDLAHRFEMKIQAPSAPASQRRESGKLPDGRDFQLVPLPNGNLRVTKTQFNVEPEQFDPENIACVQDRGATRLHSPADLVPGYRYLVASAGRPFVADFIGRDPAGHLQFGHSNEYTPREWESYLAEQQARVDKERLAEETKQQRRAEGAAALRSSELTRLGLSEAHLANPEAIAHHILAHDGQLGFDGQSIYPSPVEKAVVALKRAQLESDPGVVRRGLVEAHLASWQAARRGEFLLWRGLQGTYKSSSPGVHYSSDPGCAIGAYANVSPTAGKGPGTATVIGLRIPTSDLVKYYREVGGVPGRNPFAEVYEVDPRPLGPERQPVVLLSSETAEQRWVFEAFERNQRIADRDAGLTDYRNLVTLVAGPDSKV